MFSRSWFPQSYFTPSYWPETGAPIAPPTPGVGGPGVGGHINLGYDFESTNAGHMVGLPSWLDSPAPPIAKPRITDRVKAAPPSDGITIAVGGRAPGYAPGSVGLGGLTNPIILGGAPIDQDGQPALTGPGGLLAAQIDGNWGTYLYVEGSVNPYHFGTQMSEEPATAIPPPSGVVTGQLWVDESGEYFVDESGDFFEWA